MTIEEMSTYCKTLFSDFKFIDMLIKFCQDDMVEFSPNENEYSMYVSTDKVIKLNEIIQNLPLIIQKDKNVSTSIYLAMDSAKRT
jgi:hypothetical protein